MMHVATTTMEESNEDEDIPFVQAVYIDGELTEVPQDQIMVHSVSLEEENDSDSVAIAIATEISSPRMSSSSTISNHGQRLTQDEDVFSTSSATTTLHETDGDRQRPLQEDHGLHTSSTPSGDEEDSQVLGAGAAGAVLGLLFGGPFFSVVLGLGMLYHSQQEGAMGDLARAMGDVALLTRKRFEELNEKHHLVDKGKNAAGKALKKIKEADRRRHHRRCCKREKFQKFLATCWKSLVAFENKHHLLSRASNKAKNHLDALVEKYTPTSDPSDQGDNHEAQ